jgi:Ca-activated chloride channel family protein
MSIRRWLVLGVVVCLLAFVLDGQARQQSTTRAVIAGIVVDSGGGVIPGATIALDLKGKAIATRVTNASGQFRFDGLVAGEYRLTASLLGFKTSQSRVTIQANQERADLRVVLEVGQIMETVTVAAGASASNTQFVTRSSTVSSTLTADQLNSLPSGTRTALNLSTFLPGVNAAGDSFYAQTSPQPNTEHYAPIKPNPFLLAADQPLSTFAADVDTASYTNVRRFLSKGQLPPADAVRVEELVNYFRFAYPDPTDGRPVSITTEISACPWAPGHKLALIGLRAKPIAGPHEGRNLTLLIDVSGSMESPDKLPLIKSALRMFVDTLGDDDRIAIVVYASATGLVLPATPGARRERIHQAIEELSAGGSTAGAAGIQLAYEVARRNFIRGGINRVILATDGDFNVGITSHDDLLALIEREKQSGIFLSVLGVGTGNLKDARMELLADKGNGHYAYLDSLQEARRVLIREGGATLETVAKDVKFQIEFNPAQVAAYRLIGYENRLMAARDFNDDTKDGGELGAGHTVTVLYEIVPADPDRASARVRGTPEVDPLRYQIRRPPPSYSFPDELMTVKVRYKHPERSTSELMERPVGAGHTEGRHLPFAAAVAEFGILLREQNAWPERWSDLADRLRSMRLASDRESVLELVETARGLQKLR